MPDADPLHGVTLKALLEVLVEKHGWEELARRVPVRCFENEPSIPSSLKFLRKTPWARTQVEAMYRSEALEAGKKRARNARRAARRAFANLPPERPDTLALIWPAGATIAMPERDDVRLEHAVDFDAFARVQRAIGFEITPTHLSELHQELAPDGMVFAHDAQGPVAVACALRHPDGWTELAWVAVDPAFRGRGLGQAVCAASIHRLLSVGTTRIVLSTPDDHLHALRIYLALGFQPVERPEKAARWDAVRRQLEG